MSKRTADLSTSISSLKINAPKLLQQLIPKTLSPTTKPIAQLSPKNVFNHDADLLGEYPPPFPPTPFQGIGNLLPPRQHAPENNSGESRVQYSSEHSLFHFNQVYFQFILSVRYHFLPQRDLTISRSYHCSFNFKSHSRLVFTLYQADTTTRRTYPGKRLT